MPLDRDVIVSAMHTALEAQPWAHAAWLGGSAAFGRMDEYSDVDMQVIVDDDRVADAFAVVESALEALSPISRRYELPMPSWHGHAQRFYQLRDALAWHMVDFVVQTLGHPNRLLEPERHGRPVVLFDREGLLAPAPLDRPAFARQLDARLADLEGRFFMFQSLVVKEAMRGDALGALHFYQSLTLRPLVELLRLRHDPFRHDFGLRYLRHDLPAPLAEQVQALAFVGDPAEILPRREQAERLFAETLAALKAEGIRLGAAPTPEAVQEV